MNLCYNPDRGSSSKAKIATASEKNYSLIFFLKNLKLNSVHVLKYNFNDIQIL